MNETMIEIPGAITARVKDGRIVGFTFVPHAANAGYFGDEIVVLRGEPMTPEDFFDMVASTLMVSEDNMTATFTCEWSE